LNSLQELHFTQNRVGRRENESGVIRHEMSIDKSHRIQTTMKEVKECRKEETEDEMTKKDRLTFKDTES
jgi:hypothetical protein